MSRSSVVDESRLGLEESFLAANTARMREAALLVCSHRMSGGNETVVAAALKAGDPRSHDSFRHYLSIQIAEYLRKLDDNLTGVYSFSYGDAEEEGEDRSSSPTEPLRLILRVRRKSAALNAILAALDESLLEEYRRLISPVGNKMTSFLDAHTVDDEEALRGTGLAAVLTSAFTPPTPIWSGDR